MTIKHRRVRKWETAHRRQTALTWPWAGRARRFQQTPSELWNRKKTLISTATKKIMWDWVHVQDGDGKLHEAQFPQIKAIRQKVSRQFGAKWCRSSWPSCQVSRHVGLNHSEESLNESLECVLHAENGDATWVSAVHPRTSSHSTAFTFYGCFWAAKNRSADHAARTK